MCTVSEKNVYRFISLLELIKFRHLCKLTKPIRTGYQLSASANAYLPNSEYIFFIVNKLKVQENLLLFHEGR